MHRVLVPHAAPAMSALGLLTADHLIDDARTLLGDWRQIDLAKLSALADELDQSAAEQFDVAGVATDRIRREWMLNLVYPGQTFDVAIPIDKTAGTAITPTQLEDAVEEFHRRNEASRLIEARSQEPFVRGIRLVATGLVDQPQLAQLTATTEPPEPIGHRRLYAGDAWHDEAPVFDGAALRPGPTLRGPALVQSRFTTLVLAPGDVASTLPNGDVLVDVAPA